MQSNIQQYYPSFYTFCESHFSRVTRPSHPGRRIASLTCHMTQFERPDWLRSEISINIMIEFRLNTGHHWIGHRQLQDDRQTFKFWDLVWLILEAWLSQQSCAWLGRSCHALAFQSTRLNWRSVYGTWKKYISIGSTSKSEKMRTNERCFRDV